MDDRHEVTIPMLAPAPDMSRTALDGGRGPSPPATAAAASSSGAAASDSDDELLCRICAGSAAPGKPLVSPCKCAGSMSGVHEGCLQRWIETRPHQDALICELCNHRYEVTFEHKFVCDCKHTCSGAACGHMSELVVLLVCLTCILSLVFLLQPEFEKASDTERVFLIAMFVVTVGFSLVVVRKVYQRWRRASSQRTLVARPGAGAGTGIGLAGGRGGMLGLGHGAVDSSYNELRGSGAGAGAGTAAGTGEGNPASPAERGMGAGAVGLPRADILRGDGPVEVVVDGAPA